MKNQPTLPYRRRERRAILEVFVSAHCWQCPEARNLAEEMEEKFLPLDVHVIDLDQPSAIKPTVVFAVPTFLLNGKVVSLGTPSREELRLQIESALNEKGVLNEPRQGRLPSLE